jgi:hypothetical protein
MGLLIIVIKAKYFAMTNVYVTVSTSSVTDLPFYVLFRLFVGRQWT